MRELFKTAFLVALGICIVGACAVLLVGVWNDQSMDIYGRLFFTMVIVGALAFIGWLLVEGPP